MATSRIVSNDTATTFHNSPQKTGEPVDRLKIYSGKALEFDGVSDRLEAGNAVRATTAFDGNNGLFTVAFWFKTSGSADGYIVDWSGSTYSTSLSILSNANGSIQARAAAFRIQTSASYNDGVWHYLVLTYDKSISDPNVNMYIDGELQTYATYTDTSSTDNVNTSTSTGTIGCKFKSSTASAFFDGALSNFQAWKKAWAAGDVQYAYKNPERLITDNSSVTSGITTSDLELWYPMNDTGVRSPQSIVYDAANTGGLETNLVTSAGTEADWGTLTYGELTNTSATGFTLTSTSDGSENAYLSAAGLLSEGLTEGIYKISLDVTQTTPFGDEQSIRWYKTGSSAETLSLTAGSNVFYRPIDTANNNSQLFFNSNGAGNDITVSNFSIQKVKQGKHVTTTFTGDELITDVNDRDFGSTNDGGTINWVQYDPESTGFTYAEDNSTDDRIEITPTSSTEKEGAELGTSHFTTLVAGRQYRVYARIYTASGSVNSVSVELGGVVGSTFQITTNTVKRTFDITVTSDAALRIYTTGTETTQWFIDDVSIKEIGIATGWTDANQQPIIPQTALMDGCVMMMFDGENDGVMTDAITDIHTKSFTFGGWLNFKSIDSWAGIAIGAGGNSHSTVRIAGTRGLYTVLDGTTAELYTTDLPTNKWVHVIVTHDISTKKVQTYINGGKDSSNSQPKTYTEDSLEGHNTNSNQNKVILFDNMGGSGGRQDGIVGDCVLFTDVAFTETQVQELYNDGGRLPATRHSQASNLTGYWINNHLTSDGKWKDLSGNNNDGTITGGENYIFFQKGITTNLCTQGFNTNIEHSGGGSLHLNGSTWAGTADYAELPQNIDIDGDFSVEMWRKLTRKYISNGDGYILGADNVDFVVIPYAQSSGKLTQVYIRTNSGDNDTITLDSNTDIGGPLAADVRPSIYEWFHVVLVRESGTYKVYINGYDINTDDRETGDSANNFTFRTIASMTGTTNAAQGFIDDLRIYDKALSIKEVTKNYNFGKSKHKNS